MFYRAHMNEHNTFIPTRGFPEDDQYRLDPESGEVEFRKQGHWTPCPRDSWEAAKVREVVLADQGLRALYTAWGTATYPKPEGQWLLGALLAPNAPNRDWVAIVIQPSCWRPSGSDQEITSTRESENRGDMT